MNSTYITIIGGIAAVLSTVSFMPQAIKIIRSRDTSGISTGMYVVTVVGFLLWTAYGVLQGAWPLIGSNNICLLLSAFILWMKLLSAKKTEKVAEVLEPIVGKDEPSTASA
jgi:MtN3 and saliva related transmembrane protein